MKKVVITLFSLVCVSTMLSAQEVPTVKLKEVVISGDGFQNTIQNTAKTIYTVTAKEIEENGYHSLPEALSAIPGVKVAEGVNGNGMIDVRGQGKDFEKNTAIIVDGVKMNPIDWGSVDLYTIPVDTVERIEVVPQNAGVLFGDNTVGGVINIITKNAQKQNYLSFGAMLASYDTHKETVDFNTTIGNTTVFGNYLDNGTDGYRENSKKTTKNVQLGFKTQINENNSIMLKYTHNDIDKKMPGSLKKEQYEKDRKMSNGKKKWGESNKNIYVVKYLYQKDNFDVSNELSLKKVKNDGGELKSWNTTYNNQDITQIENNLKLKYLYGDNKIITGIDYFYGKVKYPTNERVDKKQSLAGFITDTYSVNDKLDLDAGVRVQKTEYKYSKNFDVFPKNAKIEDSKYTNIAFNLGGRYQYSDTGSVYLSAGKDFRTALTRELVSGKGYYNKIKPQEQYSAELGLRDNIKDFYIQSSVYYTKTDDLIYYKKGKVSSGDYGYNTNYDGKTQKYGYELLVEKNIFDNLKLSGNYSYVNNKYKTGIYAGKYIPAVSKHKFAFGVHYNPTENLNTNLIGNYYSSSYAWYDDENIKDKVKAYMTLDFNVNYKINEHFKLYGGVKNLTNKKYFEKVDNRLTSGREFYPAMERRYFAGFEYKIF